MGSASTTLVQTLMEALASRRRNGPPLAVFDCDGTVIQGDIGEAMLYHQLEHFLFRVSPATVWTDHPHREELHDLYEHLAMQGTDKASLDQRFGSFADQVLAWYFDQLAEGGTVKACADIVRLCAGFSPTELRQIAAETVTVELHAPFSTAALGSYHLPRGIRFIEETVTMLHSLRAASADIWVVSGSNTWSVEAVMERLGVPRDRILGINLVPAGGKLSPTVKEPIPVLHGKVEALRQYVGRPPDIVLSDSLYDLPLFEYSAGLKVLVNSNGQPGGDFFSSGHVSRDDSWVVIESPTLRS